MALWSTTDWRALRQYASPIFIRGNPFALTALFLLVSSLVQIASDGISREHHGANTSAMGISFAMSAIAAHYWRQVDNPIAPAVPGLQRSEYRAALAFAALVGGVLATLLFRSGATSGGAAAYVATALAFGSFVPTQRNGTHVQMALRMLIMLPIMVLSFVPSIQTAMLTLPAWIGWPVAVCAAAGIANALTFDRVRTTDAMARMETMLERSGSAPARRAGRDRGQSTNCLPATLSSSTGLAGEIAAPAGRFLAFLLFAIPSALVSAHGHGSTWHAVAPVVRVQVPLAAALSIMTSGDWLRHRDDWPILFATGFHGSRLNFARALTAAFIRRAVIMSIVNAVIMTGILAAMGSISIAMAGLIGLAVASALFGASCLPCAIVLTGRFGSQGLVFAGAILGMILAAAACEGVCLGAEPRLPALLGSVALLLVGVLLLTATPRRLARTDWPLETG